MCQRGVSKYSPALLKKDYMFRRQPKQAYESRARASNSRSHSTHYCRKLQDSKVLYLRILNLLYFSYYSNPCLQREETLNT